MSSFVAVESVIMKPQFQVCFYDFSICLDGSVNDGISLCCTVWLKYYNTYRPPETAGISLQWPKTEKL